MKLKKDKPKVLIYDIENTPNLGYVWGKWQQDVLAYEKESYMLSFAYKWQGERKVRCLSLLDFNDRPGCDKGLVKALWALFDEADVVIAHNGDKFDQKKTNARFAVHGLKPPSPYKSIDTLKVARKYFKFNSNKLDDLGRVLKVGRKIKHQGIALWLDCMAGKRAAWKIMIKYNKMDVVLLEKVYLRLRAWIDNHPNIARVNRPDACPKCGSGQFKSHGWRYTKTRRYRRFRCLSCQGFFKGSIDAGFKRGVSN